MRAPLGDELYYVAEFPGNQRGLGGGTAVELEGNEVGEVEEAHLVALQLDRRTAAQAALIAGEFRDVVELIAQRRSHRRPPVVVQVERGAGRTGRPCQHFLGRLEGDAAGQQLLPGVGSEAHALGADRQVHTARVPEPRLWVNQMIVGRADEGRDFHALPIGTENIVLDLSDGHAAVGNRCAAREGSEIGRIQDEGAPGRIRRQRRRLVESRELALRASGLTRIHFDVRARHQRRQPRNAAHSDPGSNDREPRILIEIIGRFAGHAGVHDDARHVSRQLQRFDHSQIDVAVLDLGLPRLQPVGHLERDGDCRAAIGERTPGQPHDDARGDDRDDPHPDEPAVRPLARDGLLLSHASSPCPTSAWSRRAPSRSW